MNKAEISKMFEFYNETLQFCGKVLLDCSEDLVGYLVFEELADYNCFFYEDNIKILLREGYIDQEAYEMTQKLRAMLDDLTTETNPLWKVEAVTTAPEWLEVMELSDKIKHRLNIKPYTPEHWGN